MHLLVIPDGNRRFAKKSDLDYKNAYYTAASRVTDVARWALIDNDLDVVTVYGLSRDNLGQRKLQEIEPIVRAWASEIISWAKADFINQNKIRVKIIGEDMILPPFLRGAKVTVEKKTRDYSRKKLNILLGYTGRWDIENAFSKKGTLNETLLLDDQIDILLRTGGAMRLSDCPLYQLAYAELFFLEKLFPELGKEDIDRVVADFKTKQRNFGR